MCAAFSTYGGLVRIMLNISWVERRHNKLVHGLASVRDLTPKQILREESMNVFDCLIVVREITKYNEDMREEKQRERARNGDWEYVDNEIHFQPENEEELKEVLIQ